MQSNVDDDDADDDGDVDEDGGENEWYLCGRQDKTGRTKRQGTKLQGRVPQAPT